jgi:hypothetical protein
LVRYLLTLRRRPAAREECLQRANAARVDDADEHAEMVVCWLTGPAGISLAELADTPLYRLARLLTDAQVPTPWGSGEWHPTQARRLLERSGLRTPNGGTLPEAATQAGLVAAARH